MTMLDESSLWARGLWAHFNTLLQPDRAFYLAVDSNVICAVGESIGRTKDNSLQAFSEVCNTLLERNRRSARVKTIALDPIEDCEHSRIICLAAQQVLVVEYMLEDDDYSEQSYFPRYRKLLRMIPRSENPLEKDDFQRVWQTLEREIRLIVGPGSPAVTFFPGIGRDFNRNLPLSQALLIGQDLAIVCDQLSTNDDAHQYSDFAVDAALSKKRSNLSRRSQKLIANAPANIRALIRNQIRAFAQAHAGLPLRANDRRTKDESGTVIAFYEDDWVSDVYRFYVMRNSKQEDSESCWNEIRLRLRRDRYVLLVAQDFFYEEATDYILPGQSVLVVVLAANSESFARRSPESKAGNATRARTDLPDDLCTFFFPEITEAEREILGIASAEALEEFSFIDGICVDQRSCCYLLGYAPTSIKVGDDLLTNETLLLVDGQETTVEQLMRRLSSSRIAQLDIQFGKYKRTIRIVDRKFGVSDTKLGFPINDGKISCLVQPVGPTQNALLGTWFALHERTNNMDFHLTKTDLVNLASTTKRRVAVDDSDLQSLLEILSTYTDNPLAKAAYGVVKTTRSVPAEVYASGLLKRILI
jgi:hypothetical protein